MPRADRFKAVRIGLVGCGRWGRIILRDLLEIGCTCLVVDPLPSARRAAQRLGACTAFALPDDLPSVDAIVVATSTSMHADVIRTLAARAIPIFCEKPLTADLHSAAALEAVLRAPLFVMDKWRFHPGIECLRDLARAQRTGRVIGLRTTRFGWQQVHEDVDPIWILAPHDLSIALEVLGTIPPAVTAVAENHGGRVVGLTAVLGRDPWMVLEVSVANGLHRRRVDLHCSEGVASLDDAYADHVTITSPIDASGTARCQRIPISTALPLRRELTVCVEYLRGGPPPPSAYADGLAVVRALHDLCERAGVGAHSAPRQDGDGTVRSAPIQIGRHET